MNTLPVPCCSILGAVLFVWGVFCLCRGGCFLHYPLACEKDHIAPQRCQKKKDTKEKRGWMGVRVSQLSA
nr:MAG TPA: GRB2-binding adapter (GAPT) [Caudoviricetes sp.]